MPYSGETTTQRPKGTRVTSYAPTSKTITLGNYTIDVSVGVDSSVTAAVSYKGHFIGAQAADDYETALLLAGGEIRYYTSLRLNGEARRMVFADKLQPGDVIAWGTVQTVEVLEDKIVITVADGWKTGVSATEQFSVRVD